MKRLLFLGFALPRALQRRHPSVNPAGNLFETQMIAALRAHFQIRSVRLLPFGGPECLSSHDPASDATPDLILQDRKPKLWHRLQSLHRLKRGFHRWQADGWRPDVVLTYNLSPVYNQFVRWLRRTANPPRLVLLLLDSTQLGNTLTQWMRFRYRLKPFAVPEAEMLGAFDACIGLSRTTERFFSQRKVRFLWMPGACTPARAPETRGTTEDGERPVRFAYFGALAAHAGALELIRVFLQTSGDSELHVSGYGKHSDSIAQLASRSARLRFHGLLPTPEDGLRLGCTCDVLVNPRPSGFGNENNFPSKLFDYALCKRAILSSRMSGVEEVLGSEAFYFEADNFDLNLRRELEQIAAIPRAELRRRGASIHHRVTTQFHWPRQAAKMAAFINLVLTN